MNHGVVLHRWDAISLDRITEMVSTKAIVGAQSKLTQAYYKQGTLVPLHGHAGETMIYVLQGAIRALVDGIEVTVREGEVLVVPPGVRHQAESLDDTFLMTFAALAARGESPAITEGGEAPTRQGARSENTGHI